MSSSDGKRRTYNPNNQLVTKDIIEGILRNHGIDREISNLPLWQRAFSHPSYCINGGGKRQYKVEEDEEPFEGAIPLQPLSSERLEWLGDKIIDSAVSKYLFKRYPRQDEGFLTKTRSKIVRKSSLADLSRKLGLAPYILLSDYLELDCGGRDNDNNLEDCFEAFIGAMSEEFEDDDLCRQFIVAVIERHIDMVELIRTDNNYKDILMRFYQKEYGGVTPIYQTELGEDGRPLGPPFTAWVLDPTGTRRIAKGVGKKKQMAEQEAARIALANFQRG